jgi:hypothetical protein
MNDMTPIIAPKSNQLTSDDLLAGDRIITISGVAINPGTEQPCQINFDGDQGKPWFPCKTMARVLVKAWGPDAKQYVGKSVQLFRDPNVTWGGMAVGGIRIRALSHIDAAFAMALTATRGKKAMARFLPLKAEVKQIQTAKQTAEEWADAHIEAAQNAPDLEALSSIMAKGGKAMAKLEADKPELWARVNTAYAARRAQIEAPGKAIEDSGEDFADDFDDDFDDEGEEA